MSVTPRPARVVSDVLRRAGIPVGYRYSQTGYSTSSGARATENGVIVTRKGSGRRNRGDDLGAVYVHPVILTYDADRFVESVVAALTAAGLPIGRVSSTAIVVPDPEA